MASAVPMAAYAEEYTCTSELEDDGGGQNHDNQEISDASERLPPSDRDERVQYPMANANHFNGSDDPAMHGQPPNPQVYTQDPGDTRDQLYFDPQAYERQAQMLDDARYQDQEVQQPTHYYQAHFDEHSMHPEPAHESSEHRSNRACVLADFQRVAAEDYGGSNERARFPTGTYRHSDHQTWAKTAPQQYGLPKATKKSSKEKKKKKPPRSLARPSATHTTKYPPTPATEQKAGRHVRFPQHPHLEYVYHEQHQDNVFEHTELVDDGTRDATPEQQLRREMQSTTLPDGSRPFSATHSAVVPISPPPTRSAVSRSAPHPDEFHPVSGNLPATSMNRHHLHSRTAFKRTSAPQVAPRADAPTIHGSTIPSSDPLDPAQVFRSMASKMERDKVKKEAHDRAEREATQRQLQQINIDRQAAEIQCHTLQQDKQNLEAEVKKSEADLAGFRNLKTYVDTFGNDYAYLKREAKSRHEKSDQVIAEGKRILDEQESSLQQLRNDNEKTVLLRNEALKVCRQAQSELASAAAQHSQLQQELNTKGKLLAEEKTLRLQLQAQLSATGHDKEAILRQLKSNNDAVLDKLYEVHGTLEESNHKQEVTEMLEKTATAVQSLGSRPIATVEDVVAVKALVESLSENVIAASNVDAQTFAQVPELKTCIEESLNSLKAELINQEKTAAEATTCRETIAGLTEKMKMSDERAVEYKTQISEAQAKVTEANELNETLKAKVAELEMLQTKHAASSTNRQGLEADLQAKASALNSVRAELDAKKEELGILQATNASLKDDIKGLQQQLKDLSAASTDFTAERAQWEKKTADAVEKKRQEMAKAVAEVNAMENSRLKDEEKILSKQSEKIKNAEQKVHDLTTQLQTTQTESSKKEQKLQADLRTAENLAQTHAQEVETLQGTINELQGSARSNAGEAEKCQRFESQLQKSKSESVKLSGKVKALEKQIETEKANRSNAESATKAAERELETSRAELESAKKQLTEAEQKVTEHDDGMERYKASCEEHRKMEEESARKREAALQDELQEAKTDLQERERKDLAFHAQVQDSWNKELAQRKEDLAKANDKTKQAEDERDKAQATVAQLQLILEQTSNNPAERGNVQNQTQMTAPLKDKEHTDNVPSAQTDEAMAHAPGTSKGITPTEAPDLTQPTRPRKRVDRNARSIKQVSAIPAPEMLRPSSARPNTGEDESAPRGPVVEESQQGLTAASGMHMASPQAGSFNPFEMDRTVRAPKPTVSSNTRYQDVVPETQFDEAVPSFAAFHAGRSSSQLKGSTSLNRTSQFQTAPDFQIYEDVNQPDDVNTQDAEQYLQDSLPPAKDPYVYEKPMPPPNSSSKLVRNHSDKSQNSRGSRGPESGHKKVERRKSSQFKTPEPNRVPDGAGFPTLSSSPGFMATSKAVRTTNTYNHGSDKKRRTSRRQSDLAKEPATKMAAPPKRKSEGVVVAGYEEERRKRMKPSNTAPTPSRAGLRSTTQIAGTESSHASLMSDLSLPRGPSQGASHSSRMQTLAGQPARAQAAKKTSKHDQMSARFQQELNRGRR